MKLKEITVSGAMKATKNSTERQHKRLKPAEFYGKNRCKFIPCIIKEKNKARSCMTLKSTFMQQEIYA